MYQNTDFGGNEFENEVRTLMKVAHKNIVRLIGYCSDTQTERVEFEGDIVLAESSQRLICMEYIPNGDIRKHILGKICNTASLVLIPFPCFFLQI
jgi:serine/threonine protein kinase